MSDAPDIFVRHYSALEDANAICEILGMLGYTHLPKPGLPTHRALKALRECLEHIQKRLAEAESK